MPKLNVKDLARELEAAISEFKDTSKFEQVGVVTRVTDGIVWVYGLKDCGFGEMLEVEADGGSVLALVQGLGEDEIGAVIIGDEVAVHSGNRVKLTGRSPEVPVGPQLLGRVVDPLGRPLDGLGPIKATAKGQIEQAAPGVIDRQAVTEPLATGIIAIDAMIPIGLGQRELVIGDRKTGKSALAIDTIINQAKRKTGVISIYVAIGQKRATIARLVDRLKDEGALAQSIIVATSPADPAPLLYLAPYAGAAMGEYFRDHSRHALVIYDDLSKHAIAYRQMSLLLRRPPGREAYPGDVFYLHSRLLERAAKLSDKLGGGSLTALPIIETQAGDISAYIPTNVISITDGQIYLEADLFYQGIRPAISVGLSVSRVGSAAQSPAIKKLAGSLRVELAQFRELAAFTQFSNDLDDDTKQRIQRGRILTEVLKQPQYQPLSLAEQLIVLIAATGGTLDQLAPADIATCLSAVIHKVQTEYPKLIGLLDTGEKIEERVSQAIVKLAKHIAATGHPTVPPSEGGNRG